MHGPGRYIQTFVSATVVAFTLGTAFFQAAPSLAMVPPEDNSRSLPPADCTGEKFTIPFYAGADGTKGRLWVPFHKTAEQGYKYDFRHYGVDYLSEHEEIFNIADGVVVRADKNEHDDQGYVVTVQSVAPCRMKFKDGTFIEQGAHFWVTYLHMSPWMNVEPGMIVRAGDSLGWQGNLEPGTETPKHLHVHLTTKPVDRKTSVTGLDDQGFTKNVDEIFTALSQKPIPHCAPDGTVCVPQLDPRNSRDLTLLVNTYQRSIDELTTNRLVENASIGASKGLGKELAEAAMLFEMYYQEADKVATSRQKDFGGPVKQDIMGWFVTVSSDMTPDSIKGLPKRERDGLKSYVELVDSFRYLDPEAANPLSGQPVVLLTAWEKMNHALSQIPGVANKYFGLPKSAKVEDADGMMASKNSHVRSCGDAMQTLKLLMDRMSAEIFETAKHRVNNAVDYVSHLLGRT